MSQLPLRRGNWSVQELERLRLLLPQRGVEQTATLLRRSPQSVQKKAHELLKVEPRRGAWTSDDDMRLRSSWGAVEPRLLGAMLGRPTTEVRRRAGELRAEKRSGPWRHAELQLLKKLYGTRSDEDLEVCLLRSRDEIEVAARRLCLAKDKRFRAAEAAAAQQGGRPQRSRMPRWTAEEIAALRRLYPENDNLTVARELGRSVTSVANKAYQLGIKKSARLLTDIGRNNVALRYRGADRAEELPRDLPEGGRRRQAGDGADAAGDGPPSSLATGG